MKKLGSLIKSLIISLIITGALFLYFLFYEWGTKYFSNQYDFTNMILPFIFAFIVISLLIWLILILFSYFRFRKDKKVMVMHIRNDTEICLKKYRVSMLIGKNDVEVLDAFIPKNESIFYISPTNAKIHITDQKLTRLIVGAIAFTEKNCYLVHMDNRSTPIVVPMKDIIYVKHMASGLSASKFVVGLLDETVIEFSAMRQTKLADELSTKIETFILPHRQAR